MFQARTDQLQKHRRSVPNPFLPTALLPRAPELRSPLPERAAVGCGLKPQEPSVSSVGGAFARPTLGQPEDALRQVGFAAGSWILTADGPKRIEELQVGELIVAAPEADPEGQLAHRPIARAYHNAPAELMNVRVGDLPMIRATLNHPFYVQGRGFVAAQDLARGDRLRPSDGWESVP